MPSNQVDEYYVDIVMCIDATYSMHNLIENVKENALSFYKLFIDQMEENEMDVGQIRVKVIAFRDYGYDSQPMEESRFFLLPNENKEFEAFVHGIKESGGGDDPENALEAIALALKSDWTTGGTKRRHCILVFSDAEALPLGARAGSKLYPSGMPKDLKELDDWWHRRGQSSVSTYQPRAGRLVAFVPPTEPWVTMQNWDRYWPVFSDTAGTASDDVDIQTAIDTLVGTFAAIPY